MDIFTNGVLNINTTQTVEQSSQHLVNRSAKSLNFSSRSTTDNENASQKHNLTNSNEQFRRATRSASALSKPLDKALSSSYECESNSDNMKIIEEKPTKKIVTSSSENLPSSRMTRSKVHLTESEYLHLFDSAQKVSVKRHLNEEENVKKKTKKQHEEKEPLKKEWSFAPITNNSENNVEIMCVYCIYLLSIIEKNSNILVQCSLNSSGIFRDSVTRWDISSNTKPNTRKLHALYIECTICQSSRLDILQENFS